MLRNAVEPIDDLRSVHTAALVSSMQISGSTPAGSVLKYSQYYHLLMTAAI